MATSSVIKKISIATVGAMFIALVTGQIAESTVLTFDDISTNFLSPIPSGYGGFNWDNFEYISKSYINSLLPGSGYANGTVSEDYTAFNPFGTPATISSSSIFDFDGAYLTGAANNALNIQVEGFLNGVLTNSTTVVVNIDAPTLFNFNFLGINELKFTSFGGIGAGIFAGDNNTQFVLDNFTFNQTATPVPEPASALSLLAFVTLGATKVMKRKQINSAS
ncbi:hypothetical protein H6F61_13810 [Cyanobacteria bacterium FACHB-472]|nr:hypothetical protein [Cyanobacteria bacterium FACHB-472]